MKKLALLAPILAAVALFAQPAFADAIPRHEKCAHSAHGETADPAMKMHDHESMMQESMEKMQAQMAEINQVKNFKKRQKLLQEHNLNMRDSIRMMREMMGGMVMGQAMESGQMMDSHKMSGHKMDGMKECDHKKCDPKMCDHKMGEHKMCDQMKGNHKMTDHKMDGPKMDDGHKMCDHMRDGSPVSQPGGNADTAPAAQANPDPITGTGKTSASQGGKIWICPMHPDVARNQPGACPICGMDLEEVEQPGTPQTGQGDANMQGDCMMGGGMKCQMMKMANKRIDMMLMLMEQMLKHNEAEMAARKR